MIAKLQCSKRPNCPPETFSSGLEVFVHWGTYYVRRHASSIRPNAIRPKRPIIKCMQFEPVTLRFGCVEHAGRIRAIRVDREEQGHLTTGKMLRPTIGSEFLVPNWSQELEDEITSDLDELSLKIFVQT